MLCSETYNTHQNRRETTLLRHPPSRRAPQRSQPHPPGACCVTHHRPEIVWWHARTSYTLDDADGMGLHHPTPDQWPDFGARDLSPSVIIPHWELGATALAWLQKPTGRVTRQRRRHLLKANSTGGFTALRCASNGTGLSSRSTTEGVFCALSHPEGNVWPSRAPRRGVVVSVVFGRWDPGEVKKKQMKRRGGGGRGRGAVRNGILHLA